MSGCKITERGWAGHFICAARCNFRRNTLIESGDTRVVVSTVGALRLKEDRQGFSDLGCDRTYETMAFMAKFDAPYWDADVSREVAFDMPWSLEGASQEHDQRANDMHEAIVSKITATIDDGSFAAPDPRP